MNYELFIATRYLKSRSKYFFSAGSLITIGGIFIGVFAVIVVMSVMNGFHKELKARILGFTPHIIITRYDYLPITNYDSLTNEVLKIPYIQFAEPFILIKTIIRKDNVSDGIVVRGIKTQAGYNIINLARDIIAGELDLAEGKIILGVDLARSINANVGDKVTLVVPFGSELTPLGFLPKLKDFTVAGIFDAGMYDYNTSFAYIGIKSLQDFTEMENKVSGIEIKLKDINKTAYATKELRKKIPYPYRVLDWMTMNRNIFTALRLEKAVTFIVLILIVLVAAFGILGLLITMVIRKTKEIGILNALGVKKKSILKIFILSGSLMGLIGTSIGVILGIVTALLLDKYRIVNLPGDVFFIKNLPVEISWVDVVLVASSAILISFLATIYPAYKAANLTPVEAIRNE
ncbi:MAG: ABC transporter permease [candidate division WOR-3 bacterium]|nr:ABC transporter permease [candidate division WOR-3 bacterium]MCX7757842.1 ABC transporter permease [candidate division WOR-3 bacterium]MDW7988056.1 ABC transporter permease [candidate division WOR-3 bacterium]